jgi:hypothetical protein
MGPARTRAVADGITHNGILSQSSTDFARPKHGYDVIEWDVVLSRGCRSRARSCCEHMDKGEESKSCEITSASKHQPSNLSISRL